MTDATRMGRLEDRVSAMEAEHAKRLTRLETERSTAAAIGTGILAVIGLLLTGLFLLKG